MATNEYSTKERRVERLVNRHFFFYYFFSTAYCKQRVKTISHVTLTPPTMLTLA